MCEIGFLIGTPRCGKSRAFDVIASHNKVAWISHHQNFLTKIPLISFYNRIYDIPSLGFKLYPFSKSLRRILPHPAETNNFWRTHLSEFENMKENESANPEKCFPSTFKNKEDISREEVKKIQKMVKRICRWQSKEYFLAEYSKWPRMTYFSEPFPNSKFVHLIRDGRAVAHDYCRKIKEGDYVEWEEKEWWVNGWPEEWKEDFLKDYNSVLAFCAYQWKFFIKLIREDAERISNDRYMETSYEVLAKQPKETFSKILDFYNLEFDNHIRQYLKPKNFKNMNFEWKEELSKDQKRQLDEIIHEPEYVELLEE